MWDVRQPLLLCLKLKFYSQSSIAADRNVLLIKLKLRYKYNLYAVNEQDEKKKLGARFSRAGLDLRNRNVSAEK